MNKKARIQTFHYAALGVIGAGFIAVPIAVTAYRETNKADIIIGAKLFAENEVLAQISKQMIDHYTDGIDVEVKYAVSAIQAPLMINNGIIDGLAEYSGTLYTNYWIDAPSGLVANEIKNWTINKWSQNMSRHENTSSLSLMNGQSPNGGIGFENNYALVTLADNATYANAKTVQDVLKIGGAMGVDNSFGSTDIGLASLYDLAKANPVGTTSGINGKSETESLGWKVRLIDSTTIRYDLLKTKQVDIIVGYTTDAELKDPTYKALDLADLKLAFPSYDAAYLFTNRVLNKYNAVTDVISGGVTSLREILNRVFLNASEMIALNYLVQNEKKSPTEVATTFLTENNYFKAK